MKKIGNVVIKNQVILNLIQDLQRRLLLLLNDMRGRFQIKFGMTSLFNHGGFTLIELLVVVLIIGILAAVAVPQYKKAILKSRVIEYEVNLKALAEAHQVYYLANGKNASNLSALDIEIPECKGIPGKFSECSYEILGGSMQGYLIMLMAGSSTVFGYSLPGIINWNGVTKPDILVCIAHSKLSTSDCHSLGYTEQIGPTPIYAKP